MSKLLEKLSAYGVDIETVMERFVDDEELYKDCFIMFINDEGFSKLGESIRKKDYVSAFDYAHMLKGVSANLGLTRLLKEICNIVEPLRHEEYDNLDKQYEDMEDALEEIKKQFGEYQK